jgi:hypothetical protein
MLHALADGLRTARGNTPAVVVQLLEGIGGVLPCTFCRASYPRLLSHALGFHHVQFLRDLPAAALPRLMYDLHTLVNYKLDWQNFEAKLPAIAAALGVAADTDALRARLGAANPALTPPHPAAPPPFYAARHPSWECMQQRSSLLTLKITAPDVMSVLFMVAAVYPGVEEDAGWQAPPPGSHEDPTPPGRRRQLFVKFISALPGALRASRCGDEKLAGIIEAVWNFCTAPPAADGGPRAHAAIPATAAAADEGDDRYAVVIRALERLQLTMQSQAELRRACVFHMAWAIRAVYKEGTVCATVEDAKLDQLAHYYAAMLPDAAQQPPAAAP